MPSCCHGQPATLIILLHAGQIILLHAGQIILLHAGQIILLHTGQIILLSMKQLLQSTESMNDIKTIGLVHSMHWLHYRQIENKNR